MNNKHTLTISHIKELLVCTIQENNQQILTYLLIKYNKELIQTDFVKLFTKALRLCKDTETHPAIPVLLHYCPELLEVELPEFQGTRPAFSFALSKGNITLFQYLLNYRNPFDLGNFDLDKFNGLKTDEKKLVKKLIKNKK